ncbi:hypothetical protein MARINON1_52282 [Marinobacter salarius]|nr:hypothetical protein MBHK15_110464 [Marinobacter salarius]VXC18060.1 hypothetical protein MARINON1_52282 [Marinobacter salarius]
MGVTLPGYDWVMVTAMEGSDQVQFHVVFTQELADFDGRRFIGKHMICLSNAAEAHHGVAAELGMVRGQQYLAGILDDGLGNPDFPVIEVQQRTVTVDAADTDNAEIHLELVDEVPSGFTHDAAVAVTHFAAGNNDVEVFLGGKNGCDVKVVGDYLEVVFLKQGLGNGFRGGADVDEHGGVVGDHVDQCFSDALLGFQVHDFASLVGSVHRAGVDAGAAVMSAQFLLAGQVVQIPADGLRRYLELINQLLGGHEAVLLDELHDQVLSASLCHSTSSGSRFFCNERNSDFKPELSLECFVPLCSIFRGLCEACEVRVSFRPQKGLAFVFKKVKIRKNKNTGPRQNNYDSVHSVDRPGDNQFPRHPFHPGWQHPRDEPAGVPSAFSRERLGRA